MGDLTPLPAYGRPDPAACVSSYHDPLSEYHRWKANLRILGIEEIKTVLYAPLSHPFVERLIGTVRGEYLDHVVFWNAADLEKKLTEFRAYYNECRDHSSLGGHTEVDPIVWTADGGG